MTPANIYRKAFYERAPLTEGELKTLATDPKWATMYALHVTRKPFRIAESNIINDSIQKNKYEEKFGPINLTNFMSGFRDLFEDVMDNGDERAPLPPAPPQPDISSQFTIRKRVLLNLYTTLRDTYDLDTAVHSLEEYERLNSEIDTIRTFCVKNIRDSAMDNQTKDSFIRRILQADTVGEIIGTISFGLF